MKHLNQIPKKMAFVSCLVLISSAVGLAALSAPQASDADDSPLIQEVQDQNDRLANHESRITKTEGDVKDIQTTTGATTTVVSGSTPQPTAKPQGTTTVNQQPINNEVVLPPKVTAAEPVIVDDLHTDCKVTYADGSVKQVVWKVVYPQGAWETDGVGQNGHYEQTVGTQGECDASRIGLYY